MACASNVQNKPCMRPFSCMCPRREREREKHLLSYAAGKNVGSICTGCFALPEQSLQEARLGNGEKNRGGTARP